MKKIDMTPLMDEFDFIGLSEIKDLTSKFDIEYAHRDDVKCYPIEMISPDDSDSIEKNLKLMHQALWLTVRSYIKNAMVLDFDTSEIFDTFTQDLKIGKINVQTPNTFMWVNRPMQEVRVFAFKREYNDGNVHLKAEIHFSIELY